MVDLNRRLIPPSRRLARRPADNGLIIELHRAGTPIHPAEEPGVRLTRLIAKWGRMAGVGPPARRHRGRQAGGHAPPNAISRLLRPLSSATCGPTVQGNVLRQDLGVDAGTMRWPPAASHAGSDAQSGMPALHRRRMSCSQLGGGHVGHRGHRGRRHRQPGRGGGDDQAGHERGERILDEGLDILRARRRIHKPRAHVALSTWGDVTFSYESPTPRSVMTPPASEEAHMMRFTQGTFS